MSLNTSDTVWTHLRGKDFFLEINSTSCLITQFLENDAQRSGNGAEILNRQRPFFFLRLASFRAGYITEIVARRSVDLQIENFMQPSTQLLTYNGPPEANEFDTPDLEGTFLLENYVMSVL